MKIGILCEFSGIVRDAFIKKGHDAILCDLLPSNFDGPHIQGDCLEQDLLICHPPCTYLCNSGVHWLNRKEGRWDMMRKAALFFKALLELPVDHICVENPVMHKYALEIIGRNYDQTIQPWQFGEDASKRTCLWLKGLPKLIPTNIIKKDKYSNQTPSGQNNLGPSKDRWKLRSKTYTGIANAMVNQWGDII